MLNFEQSNLDSQQKDSQDSFEFGKTSKKKVQNFYEKCAFQCVNMTLSLTQQEANCIKACYNKEYNMTGFKDAKLYL